ncbi:MAG: hypothetical protein AAB354_01135 [candidate division KSB1 bacterium]
MIVLDEQLLGRGIEQDIAKWYQGKVLFITDLRPNSVVKDEAVPELLRGSMQPTFVTINESDFWKRILADKKYCIVCLAWSDARVREIPAALRALLGRIEFNTKVKRMGKVIRLGGESLKYYAALQRQVIIL